MSADPEDLFDPDGDDDDLEPQGPQDSSVIRKLRRDLREARKQAKALEERQGEYEALVAFRSQVEQNQRVRAAEQEFSGLGLSPKYAQLFLKDHEGEITEGQVRQWAQDYELLQEQEEESPRFAPTPQGAPPPPPKFTKAQLDDLLRTDPAAGFRAMDEGRVDWAQT